MKPNLLTPLILTIFVSLASTEAPDEDDCFCQLQGKIDDCTCNVDTVDHFNNIKLHPRLKSLLSKDYFRFYKVNLAKECPFWSDDSRCAVRHCHVQACREADLPPGLLRLQPPSPPRPGCDHDPALGYLNTSISAKLQGDIARWTARDSFCLPDDDAADAAHVDLLLNPERYTGYRGRSARRIWRSVYSENCFRAAGPAGLPLGACLEERVFYRAVSGLHASINVHLCAQHLLAEASLGAPAGRWGRHLGEFQRRFAGGEGPARLQNLYFAFLLEVRALAKAAPYLRKEQFYTGNEAEDFDTQLAVRDLLHVVSLFPGHFNESSLFAGGDGAAKLKEEFKTHFRNVSRIMDCVGCDKCKLWGKLQIQGLGTAMKVLFSGKFENANFELLSVDKHPFKLQRNEIVSLVNSIGRLSTSIYEVDEFRHLLR